MATKPKWLRPRCRFNATMRWASRLSAERGAATQLSLPPLREQTVRTFAQRVLLRARFTCLFDFFVAEPDDNFTDIDPEAPLPKSLNACASQIVQLDSPAHVKPLNKRMIQSSTPYFKHFATSPSNLIRLPRPCPITSQHLAGSWQGNTKGREPPADHAISPEMGNGRYPKRTAPAK